MSVQEVSYAHAVELANAERYDEALQIAGQLARAHTEVVDYVLLLARLTFDRGDKARAYAILDEALVALSSQPLQPAHRLASRGLLVLRYGLLLMSEGRCREALPWLHEAARRNGLATGDWTALLHAGLAHFRLGEFAEAGRFWYALLYRAPDLGVEEILPLCVEHVNAAGERAEPMLRVCLGRIALDNPGLLGMDAAGGDAVALDQAGQVLAAAPDHPQARRLRAPLRHGVGDIAGALDDLDTYLRQQPDPQAQVRALAWRQQAAAAAGNAAAVSELWQRFAFDTQAQDAAGYYRAAEALADLIAETPAAETALRPQLVQALRLGQQRFEHYFDGGEGSAEGHGGDADPHLYALLCRLLARSLPAGAAHVAERIELHRKGIAASEFIAQWIDLLDSYAEAGDHHKAVEAAGEVLNRYPVERDPANVGWVVSRLMAAWLAIGGGEATESARIALAHMDTRLDGLPVEARSESAHAMAHARAHLAALLQAAAVGAHEHDRADLCAEIEALQRRALLVEDAWLFNRFGLVWRGLGDSARAFPLFEQAIALAGDDARDAAGPRVQRALILTEQQRHAEALADFDAAFAVRDDWDAEACLVAVQAALGMERRETALEYFGKARARGAAQGRSRGLYAKVETALRATRPKWKLWGV